MDEAQLPEGEVTIAVEYSTINYKDGLAFEWKVGDQVTVNRWDLGESHWGGLAQKARVNANKLTAIPGAFSTQSKPPPLERQAIQQCYLFWH